jgi:repressor of nif and glnA expression
MTSFDVLVPEDPAKPGKDVLGVSMKARGHYIHIVLAQESPLSPKELGEKAEPLAEQDGYDVKEKTFSPEVTRNHLRFLEKKGFVEQLSDNRWQFTQKAKLLLRR